MADSTGQTIIIKKIKKAAHGHHGGAWKVAYADFVTAMMAFFLLMWLLNATEAVTLSGLADYFAPTIGVKDNMGIGFRGGKAALSKGMGADKNTNKGIIYGGTPAGPIVKVIEKIEPETEEPDDEKVQILIGKPGTTEFQGTEKEAQPTEAKAEPQSLAQIAESLQSYINDINRQSQDKQSVAIVQTTEGLEIQIQDTEGNPMFKPGTADMEPRVQEMLSQLAGVLARLPNYLSVTGHTSSVPVRGKKGYGNWELSADRANAARRFLIQSGVQPEQFERVIGKADNEPLDPKHPAAPVNNRIGIVLLRDAAMPEHKLGAPAGVFIDPRSTEAKELEDEDDTQEPQPEKSKDEEHKELIKEDSGIKEDIHTIDAQKDAAAVEAVTKEDSETSQDPTGLSRGAAAGNAFTIKEETPKAEAAGGLKAINKGMFEENTEEQKAARQFEGTEVQDPIASGKSIDPLKDVPEDKPLASETKLKAVNEHLLEEDKNEEKGVRQFEGTTVEDPFGGKAAIDPLQKVQEEKPKEAPAPKPVNSYLLEEDKDEEKGAKQFEDTAGQDPFASGKAIDPFSAADAAAQKEQEEKKKVKPAPVNEYLLAPDKDEKTTEKQFESLPVQDPFGGGGSFNPLGDKQQ